MLFCLFFSFSDGRCDGHHYPHTEWPGPRGVHGSPGSEYCRPSQEPQRLFAEKNALTFDHLDGDFSVQVMGMYRKGNPGLEVKVDDFEKFRILNQKKPLHDALGKLAGRVEIEALHLALLSFLVILSVVARR